MHTIALAVIVILAFAGSSFAGEQPLEKATLSADATCSTFDSQQSQRVHYTCFVHSKQSAGQDVSSPAARAALIEHRLSAVCSKTSILSDALFVSEGTPPVQVWRIEAQCTLLAKR